MHDKPGAMMVFRVDDCHSGLKQKNKLGQIFFFAGKFEKLRRCRRFRRSWGPALRSGRSEEHTSELQSLMRISYAVLCLKKKNNTKTNPNSKFKHKIIVR